jgi:hypothetical protein
MGYPQHALAVDLGADGTPGKPGDKHYQSYHENKKILTINHHRSNEP